MTTILALDAAWTATEPSGVAVVAEYASGWKCLTAVPSYAHFFALADGNESSWDSGQIKGTPPESERLLTATRKIAGTAPDLVVLDMPVARVPFSSRRVADDAISAEFGSRWCAAHSPSATRPGELGAKLSSSLDLAGFPLATASGLAGRTPCLIEVYPHPALLSLLRRSRRVPYKVSKSKRYWPKLNVQERTGRLLGECAAIHDALSSVFGRLPFELPVRGAVASLNSLKRYEDTLDALICAWVGVEYLKGGTVAMGDGTAAIWCPRDVVLKETQPLSWISSDPLPGHFME